MDNISLAEIILLCQITFLLTALVFDIANINFMNSMTGCQVTMDSFRTFWSRGITWILS